MSQVPGEFGVCSHASIWQNPMGFGQDWPEGTRVGTLGLVRSLEVKGDAIFWWVHMALYP